MATERELIDQRNVIAQQLRTMLSEAGTAGFTPEQEANYTKMDADMAALEEQVKNVRKNTDRLASLEEHETRLRETSARTPVIKNAQPAGSLPDKKNRFASAEYKAEYARFLRGEMSANEVRALQTDSPVAGGFTRPDEDFQAQLIQAIDDDVIVRQLGRGYTLDRAESLTFPTRSADISDATWGTELQVATADTALQFGKRALTPHPLTAQILVSKLLFKQSKIDVNGLVNERMAYKFSVPMENAYMTGDGAGKPLGLFTISANGLSSGRDIITGASSVNPTANHLIATFYNLKATYRRNASWILNRTYMSTIRRIQDSNNNYVWTPAGFGVAQGLTVGKPDMILGAPYFESEFSPSTLTASGTAVTGSYAIVGDFKAGYYYVDGADLGINRYDQINAATNQDTFIGLFQTDGAPVLEEAFSRARGTST